MSVRRTITALLAAVTTLAGGSAASAAASDADTDASERSARSVHVSDRPGPTRTATSPIARALGVSDERLVVALRELRAERRPSDVEGARPAIATAGDRERERAGYAAALATKVGVPPERVADALGPPPRSG